MRYKIKVKSVHWTQIRMLMKLGYEFVEKNQEKLYYIIETHHPLHKMKKLEGCNWVDSVIEYKESGEKKDHETSPLTFEKIGF